MSDREKVFLILCTQSKLTKEKEGGKTSSFKVRRERVRTECHSSWIPFWRERRRDGWPGEKETEEEGRKDKAKS